MRGKFTWESTPLLNYAYPVEETPIFQEQRGYIDRHLVTEDKPLTRPTNWPTVKQPLFDRGNLWPD